VTKFSIFLSKAHIAKRTNFERKNKINADYEEWLNDYSTNHTGSSDKRKMEVNAIIEMFKGSEENYSVKYIN